MAKESGSKKKKKKKKNRARARTSSNHSQVERRGVHLILDGDTLRVDQSVERLFDKLGKMIRQVSVRRSLKVVVDGV